MQEGELYIVKDGELKHLPRSDDDLPKVPVSEAARDALLQVRRKCRKALGGFRPDLALVTSALVLYACEREPIAIVVDHFRHASLETTQLYTRVTINDLQAMHARFHPREQGQDG